MAELVLLGKNPLSSSNIIPPRSSNCGSGLIALAFKEESLPLLLSMWGTKVLLLTEARL